MTIMDKATRQKTINSIRAAASALDPSSTGRTVKAAKAATTAKQMSKAAQVHKRGFERYAASMVKDTERFIKAVEKGIAHAEKYIAGNLKDGALTKSGAQQAWRDFDKAVNEAVDEMFEKSDFLPGIDWGATAESIVLEHITGTAE
jgi:hypothetical protein